MALGCLVGSEGHFGQAKLSSSASTIYANPDDSVLILHDKDVDLLVELLANTLHNRGKDGPGGYSAATFSVKYVLFAIRCLLTHTNNQARFSNHANLELNCLLVKALAHHAIQKSLTMDTEAAEFACFSLYLQSNYGFKLPFLPTFFTTRNDKGKLLSKVLTSYLHTPNITPAGQHAAEQLLLRLKYLYFAGSTSNLVSAHILTDFG